MKGIPAMPGDPLTSKPTWLNTSGCSATSAFFVNMVLNREFVMTVVVVVLILMDRLQFRSF